MERIQGGSPLSSTYARGAALLTGSHLNYRCALDGLGYGTGMETTPAAWLARKFATRDDRVKRCEHGAGYTHIPERCTRTYVVGEARRAGHAGYCSHEHAADAQENEYI